MQKSDVAGADSSSPARRWGFFRYGLIGGTIGAAIGMAAGATAVAGSGASPLNGLLVAWAIILGWIAGALFATCIAIVRHRRHVLVRELLKRALLSVCIIVLPLGLFGLLYIPHAVDELTLWAGSRTDETTELGNWLTDDLPVGGTWSVSERRNVTRGGCSGQVSATEHSTETHPSATGPALIEIGQRLEVDAWEVQRFTLKSIGSDSRWALHAHKGDQRVEVTATRSPFTGSLSVASFAGSCLSYAQGELPTNVLDDRWSASDLTASTPAADRLDGAYAISTLPDGSRLSYQAPYEPGWPGCPASGFQDSTPAADATSTPTRRVAVSTDVDLFDWYQDRADALAEAGWEVERARVVTPDSTSSRFEPFDREEWLIWAVKGDIAISLVARFRAESQLAEHKIYVAPCIATSGTALIEHAPWFDETFLAPARDSPPERN